MPNNQPRFYAVGGNIIKLCHGGVKCNMATSSDKYSTLYKINLNIQTNNRTESINIQPSDIISIMMVNNYDSATFPIIRIRLYSDLSVMETLTEYPDQIYVVMNLYGNMYKMNDENDKSPIPVSSATNISLNMKGYIENKNTPTSVMDQYEHGIKKSDDLNTVRKVPIELYCYNDELIHFMRRKSPSIFKNMSLTSVIESIFRKQGVVNFMMEPIQNQEKYDQILIPNLNINETLSFFDSRYCLYPKGAQVYGDIDKLYICDTTSDNGTKALPIYVDSYKSGSDMGGMVKYGDVYQMSTKAINVSVISETDIEKVLNAENITSVNVNTLDVESVAMVKLFPDTETDSAERITSTTDINKYIKILRDKKITTTDILHKSMNTHLAEMFNARISERITRVDVSGVGFDIGKLKINSRYNLIFESPIRGMSINQFYRATTVSHVISNLSSDLFVAQTTMNLCSN